MKRLNIFKMMMPLILFLACTKDISQYNVETKKPAEVPGASVFANAVKNLADDLASSIPLRTTVKHWAASIYQDEARYNFTSARVPQNWWTGFYQDVLNNLQSAAKTINNSNINEDIKSNQLAIIEMMQVYTFHILVSTFGDVPYSEALDSEQLFPKYDDAATIYDDLMKRLDESIAALKLGAAAFSANDDVLYQGDVTKWYRFGNSLKLKIAMTLVDVDETRSKTAVEAAFPNVFQSSNDNALVQYPGISPSINPLHQTLILSLRSDYVSARDLLDELIRLNDPRLDDFYRPNNNGDYVGGIVGTQNTFSDVAKPSYKISAPDAPSVFLDYSEVLFYLAEAKARNFNISGSVSDYYHAAIRESILYWGGSELEADTYLSQTEVAYETAEGGWKQKIGTQKWVALYNRAFDAWTELRRLDYPKMSLPEGALSGFPNRYTYPGNEQQLNQANYTAASNAIGGDKLETKLFWDLH